MSMIVTAQHAPHSASQRDFGWGGARQPEYASSRRQNDFEKIELPSIRQAFPELQLRILPSDTNARAPSSTTSPVGTAFPSFTHSPNPKKRGRTSVGRAEIEERHSQIPRLYTSPQRDGQMLPWSREISPTFAHQRSATESWTSHSLPSPHAMPHTTGSLPSMRDSGGPMEISDQFSASRPILPRLPNMNFERDSATTPRIRGRSSDDDYSDGPRHIMSHHHGAAGVNETVGVPPHFSRNSPFFGSHHPSRNQSLSLGSAQSFDRTPFSPAAYVSGYQDYMRGGGEMGPVGLNGSGPNKQRKRRGNLPKETTDKLWAWFGAHLNHPYPSEDEKQELARRTRLQMNQISNWFINARRRQLPAMIKNARAESDATSLASARSAGSGERGNKVLASTELGSDYDTARKSAPLSDGEGSAYDDDLDSPKRLHTTSMSCGSV